MAEPVPTRPIRFEAVIHRLEAFPSALERLIPLFSTADLVWRPAPGHWSVTEILAHLALEEVRDFRARLEKTLAPEQPEWEALDPEADVRASDAHARGAAHWLELFREERARSVSWLRGLKSPDWSRLKTHRDFPPIAAGELLGSWVAHDALHIRQIARRLHQLAQRDAGAFPVGYAGSWKERV